MELSKAEKIVEKSTEEMNTYELWAVFFQYLTDKSKREKINKIVKREEGIAMASEVLMTISKDEEERARLMRDEKILLDYQSYMVHAKREGRREGMLEGRRKGMLEGRREGRLETARNALAKGYSIENIHEITGLDFDIIKNLRAEIN